MRPKGTQYLDERCADLSYSFFCHPPNFERLYSLKNKLPPYKDVSWRLLQFASQKTYEELFGDRDTSSSSSTTNETDPLPAIKPCDPESDYKYWTCNKYGEAVGIWSKRNFDTYCKNDQRIQFALGSRSVETTSAQLNFLKTLIETGALDFIATNIDFFRALYRKHMQTKRRGSTSLSSSPARTPTPLDSPFASLSLDAAIGKPLLPSGATTATAPDARSSFDVDSSCSSGTDDAKLRGSSPIFFTPHGHRGRAEGYDDTHTPAPTPTPTPSRRPLRPTDERRAAKKKKRSNLLAMFVSPSPASATKNRGYGHSLSLSPDGSRGVASAPLAMPQFPAIGNLSKILRRKGGGGGGGGGGETSNMNQPVSRSSTTASDTALLPPPPFSIYRPRLACPIVMPQRPL